jgi:hypothetical protein
MGKKSNFKYGKLYYCHFVAVYTVKAYKYSNVLLSASFVHKFTDQISTKIWVFFDVCCGVIRTNILEEHAASVFIMEVTLQMEAAHSSEVCGIVC